MYHWEKFKFRDSNRQFTFHFVCCEKFDSELERIRRVHFADFTGRKRGQVVNALLTLLEPYLRHHLNLSRSMWDLDLEAGEMPMGCGGKAERGYMERELRVFLDPERYRVIKKLHESVASHRGGTFSMALVLRAALMRCFALLDELGRDGLVLWVKQWLKDNEKRRGPKFREKWKPITSHMAFFKSNNVKYIALYTENYRQIHLYHPPPTVENT